MQICIPDYIILSIGSFFAVLAIIKYIQYKRKMELRDLRIKRFQEVMASRYPRMRRVIYGVDPTRKVDVDKKLGESNAS